MDKWKKLLCGVCIAMMSIVSFSAVEVNATESDGTETVVVEVDATKTKDTEKDEGTGSLPQLVVESYEITEGVFKRSAECTLRVHIRNVSTNSGTKMGSVALHSSYVAPVFGKTNQIMFGEVGPGESVYVDFEVNLDNVINGPNLIELILNWVDEDEVRDSNLVYITPILLEKVEFDISSIKVPGTVYGSKNTTLSVSYENTGAENLQNVYMIIDGDLAQGVQVVELEDISAKQKEMVDYSLELLNMGENHISVSFKYEDRNGTEYITEAIESVVTVTDKNYISPTPQKTDVKELLEEYRVFVVGAIIAVLLCIPFLISVLRRGGKKR